MLLPDGAGGGATRVGHRDQLGHEGGATRFVATCAFGKWHYSCGEGGHTDLQFLQRCNFLRDLYGATFFPYEARCNLASPASRKPRQESRNSARPEFSIIRLKNNSIYLKPDESFVYIGGRVSIS